MASFTSLGDKARGSALHCLTSAQIANDPSGYHATALAFLVTAYQEVRPGRLQLKKGKISASQVVHCLLPLKKGKDMVFKGPTVFLKLY